MSTRDQQGTGGIRYFGALALLCVACVSPRSPRQTETFPSLEETKTLHPGFDLFLCGKVDSAENLVHSKSLWRYGEKSICKDTASDVAFRLAYWTAEEGEILIRMEKSQGRVRMVSKKMEYRTTGDQVDSSWIVQKEHPIGLEDADSLFVLIRQVDFPYLVVNRRNCLDGNIWQVEIKDIQAFHYYRLYCSRDRELVDLGKYLREKIGLPYPID